MPKVISLDSKRNIKEYPPICGACVHWNALGGSREYRVCAAFPNGIPLEIWNGENDHSKSYPGDNEIQFEEVEFNRAA